MLNPITKIVRIKDLVELDGQRWDSGKLAEYLHPKSCKEALQTPLSFMVDHDSFWWPGTKSGEYTVRSGYQKFREQSLANSQQTRGASTSYNVSKWMWNTIWGAPVPQKVKVFVWKLMHNSLATKENLYRRKLGQSELCPICGQGKETAEHIFLLCEWTIPVWFGLGTISIPQPNQIPSIQKWLEECCRACQTEQDIGTIFQTLWAIWKARNDCVFTAAPVDPLSTLLKVKMLSREYAVAVATNSGNDSSNTSNASPTPQQIANALIWRPPVTDRIKVNTDASWLENGKATGGIIGRNTSGMPEILHALDFRAPNPIIAEAVVLRSAVNLVANLGIKKVTFETDCLEVVQACTKVQQAGAIQGIIADIHSLVQSFEEFGFTWVNRKGNEVAHLIARLKAQNQLNSSWTSSIPIPILQAMHQDVANWREGC